MAYSFPTISSPTSYVRSGKFTTLFWIPYTDSGAGIEKGAVPTENKIVGLVCTAENMDNPTLSPLNEREIFSLGKTKTVINDGVQLDPFSISVHGNAVGILGAVTNQDLTVDEAIIHAYEYGLNGALVVISHTGAGGTVQRSDLYLDVKVRIPDLPGATDGDSQQTVTFYSEEAKVYSAFGTNSWAVEVFRDDAASITNANAPNGILTAFTLGNGNASTGTPTAISWNPNHTGTSVYEYMAKLSVDGVDVVDADINTYGATSVTWNTAPADGATILMIYMIDTASDDFPLHLSGSTTDVSSMWYAWDDYLQ
ncbi:MAG: hypothetical protein GWN62_16870 [Aliifodinibius sp.]|nr:hypothetical protein [Fodinibius sp.]